MPSAVEMIFEVLLHYICTLVYYEPFSGYYNFV